MASRTKKKRSKLSCCLLFVVLVGGAGLGTIALGICVARHSFFDLFSFGSDSMEPTFHAGDRIVVDKAAYGTCVPFTSNYPSGRAIPARGDLVAFTIAIDNSTYVKRVVGLPGDTVRVRKGLLSVNGEVVETTSDGTTTGVLYPNSYEVLVATGGGLDQDSFTVSSDRFFVLGDNRGSSADSRTWGELPLDSIQGKVDALYWRVGQGPVWEPL